MSTMIEENSRPRRIIGPVHSRTRALARMHRIGLPISLALGWLCACSEPGTEFEITARRRATVAPVPVAPGASSAMRFGNSFGAPAGFGGFEGSGAADVEAPRTASSPAANPLHWTTPPGWLEKPSESAMRLSNHEVGGDPRAECYVSVLPGNGGGASENVNRWRKQMGLPDLDAQEIAALPRLRVLGGDAIFLELEGTFTGMGIDPMPDARLIGAILELPEIGTLFVKMTGPSALLDAERRSFQMFCSSLHISTDGHTHGDPGGAAQPAAAPSAGASESAPSATNQAGGLAWTVPAGWIEQGPRSMRVVSFALGEGGRTECYVAILGGGAGGRDMNVNRWRDQLGLADLTRAEIDALPSLEVLGEPGTLVEAFGEFDGMGKAVSDAGLLGLVCERPGEMLFVKLIGPSDDVRAAKPAFLEFCQSLKVSE